MVDSKEQKQVDWSRLQDMSKPKKISTVQKQSSPLWLPFIKQNNNLEKAKEGNETIKCLKEDDHLRRQSEVKKDQTNSQRIKKQIFNHHNKQPEIEIQVVQEESKYHVEERQYRSPRDPQGLYQKNYNSPVFQTYGKESNQTKALLINVDKEKYSQTTQQQSLEQNFDLDVIEQELTELTDQPRHKIAKPTWRSSKRLLNNKDMMATNHPSSINISFGFQNIKEKTLSDKINEITRKYQKLDKQLNNFKQTSGSRVNMSQSPSRSPKKSNSPSIEQQNQATDKLFKNDYKSRWREKSPPEKAQAVKELKKRRRQNNKKHLSNLLNNSNVPSSNQSIDISNIDSGSESYQKQRNSKRNIISPQVSAFQSQSSMQNINNEQKLPKKSIKTVPNLKIKKALKKKEDLHGVSNLKILDEKNKEEIKQLPSENKQIFTSIRGGNNIELNNSGIYEINEESIKTFNEVSPSDENLEPNELSIEFRKRNSDQNISILNDDSTQQIIPATRLNTCGEESGTEMEVEEFISMVNLPQPDKLQDKRKTAPDLQTLIMKRSNLEDVKLYTSSQKELDEVNERECTDLFLYIDVNNVNYLTWDQIQIVFKDHNLLTRDILNQQDKDILSFSYQEDTLKDVQNNQKEIQFEKRFKSLKKQFKNRPIYKNSDSVSLQEFIKLLEIAEIDVSKARDQFFDAEFETKYFKKITKCFKDCCFRRIRQKMVKKYIEQLKYIEQFKQPETQWLGILNTIRKSILENIDQFAHLTLLSKIYYVAIQPKNADNSSYKIAFSIIGISFMSSYLIQHSSTLKMMLQKGWYEPQITKNNTFPELFLKLLFLTFIGPIQLVMVEILVLMMTITQLLALFLPNKKENYNKVQKIFMRWFYQGFGLYEDEVEGIMKQRAIVQLFFEDMPVIIVQICIYLNILNCPTIIEDSRWQLMFSFCTSLMEIFITFQQIYIESVALEEPPFTYVLNCFQAKQGWIPFLNQMKTGNIRHYIDYSEIRCTLPGITGKTAYYYPIRYKFSNISLQTFIQELVIWNDKVHDDRQLSTNGGMIQKKYLDFSQDLNQMLDCESNCEESESEESVDEQSKIIQYTFDIGRSIDYVTLNMVLHFYQLAPKERVIIKFTEADWLILIKNSIKLKLSSENSDNKWIAKTPSGSDCLWICGDDENAAFESIDHDNQNENQIHSMVEIKDRFKSSRKSYQNSANSSLYGSLSPETSRSKASERKLANLRLSGKSREASLKLPTTLSKKMMKASESTIRRQTSSVSPSKKLIFLKSKKIMSTRQNELNSSSLNSHSQSQISLSSQIKTKKKKVFKGGWVLEGLMIEMLAQGFDSDIMDNTGETFINHTIKTNKLKCLKLLLDNGSSSYKKNQMGMSPLGQCIVSQNVEALRIIVENDCQVDEKQVIDHKISNKLMTISMYMIKLLRIYTFYHQKISSMMNIISDKYTIEIKNDQDKQVFFKQFAKIFCTGESDKKTCKDDFGGDTVRYEQYAKIRDASNNQKLKVANLLKKFNPTIDILKDLDTSGNNFIHLITNNYLPFTIRRFMLGQILEYTSITEVKKQVKNLAKKKNNDDLSPIEMALNMIYFWRKSLRLIHIVKETLLFVYEMALEKTKQVLSTTIANSSDSAMFVALATFVADNSAMFVALATFIACNSAIFVA